MPSGTATFSCTIANLPTGSKTIAPAAVALTAAVGKIIEQDLATGNNAFTIPSGSTYAVLEFPITTETVLWKKSNGETGTQLFAGTTIALFMVMLVKGETSFVLNSTGTVVGVEVSFA